MKSNALTIIKKEFARFFGDRQLLFGMVIMPGLLIYIIYSLMGNGLEKMMTEGQDEMVTLRVENLPESLAPMVEEMPSTTLLQQPVTQEEIDNLEDKNLNEVVVRFPEEFDEMVETYSPQTGVAAPNVEIYYNSANNASNRVYTMLDAQLSAYEDQMSNRFDINRIDGDDEEKSYDMASHDDVLGSILSKLIPMLILMMLFSGVMAIAPSSIAGEKERGTIATLLVTPMRRNELALGKVISLSGIALLSGISSFLGILLSLPKLIPVDAAGVELGLNYTGADYTVLLLTILATVLIMASVVSLLSALAKDVKNAGTMITPFMLVVMFCGLMPMFQSHVPENLAAYLVPFYNSIQVMTATFAHEMTWAPVIVTLCSNVVYSGVAVWGLTKMFGSEKVMFSR